MSVLYLLLKVLKEINGSIQFSKKTPTLQMPNPSRSSS